MIGESDNFIMFDKQTLHNILTSEIVTIFMMCKLIPDFDMNQSKAEDFAKDSIEIAIMDAKKDGVYKYDSSVDKM